MAWKIRENGLHLFISKACDMLRRKPKWIKLSMLFCRVR